METITIALVISVLGIVLNVFNFYYARKKDTITDVKEQGKESSNQQLIDYRLTQVEKKLDKILDILDSYEDTTKKIVQDEIDKHLLKYHNK